MAINVLFKFGSQSEYDSLLTHNPFALYWCNDTQRIYKGDDLMRTGAEATELAAGLLSPEDYQLLHEIAYDLSNKVDQELELADGRSLIFNETDGGGAKVERKIDGVDYASFAGVNSDVKDGIGAQIYDIDINANKGVKLDVTRRGIFYTNGDDSALSPALRDVEDNELVVRKDIKDLIGVLHFRGVFNSLNEVDDPKNGDVVIIGTKEYVYVNVSGQPVGWKEFGDEGIYATKEQLEAEKIARAQADNQLNTAIEARKLEILPVSAYGFNTNLRENQQVDGSTLVDKVIELTNVDKKQAVIKSGDYKYNVISIVNDEVLGIKGFAIETMNIPMTSLEDEPAIEKGVFLYNPTLDKTCTFYGVEYTSKQIETVVAEIQATLSRKLNILPNVEDPSDPRYGWPYHIPYNIKFEPKADKAEVTLQTLTLDNNVTKMDFKSDIPCANENIAGLMSAEDKVSLGNKQDKLTAGSNITISEDNIISAVVEAQPTIKEELVAEYTVGGIKYGTVFEAGTSIEHILHELFTNHIPVEETDILYGSSTKIPTDISSLNEQITKDVNVLINDGMVQNIMTGDTELIQPQYTVIACKNFLELTNWQNDVTKISYMTSVHKVTYGDYNIYYKDPTCYDADIGGEDYKFEFKEAEE